MKNKTKIWSLVIPIVYIFTTQMIMPLLYILLGLSGMGLVLALWTAFLATIVLSWFGLTKLQKLSFRKIKPENINSVDNSLTIVVAVSVGIIFANIVAYNLLEIITAFVFALIYFVEARKLKNALTSK